MNTLTRLVAFSMLLLTSVCEVSSQTNNQSTTHDLSFTISSNYLNLPVSQDVNRGKMSFEVEGKPNLDFVIRLSSHPDYWVFYDVSPYKGKVLKISYTGDPGWIE